MISLPSSLKPHLPHRLSTRLRVVSLLLIAPLLAVAAVSVVALQLGRSSEAAVAAAEQQSSQLATARSGLEHVLSLGEAYLAGGDPETALAMAGASAQVDADLLGLAGQPSLPPAQAQLAADARGDWQESAALRSQVAAWGPDQDITTVSKEADNFRLTLQHIVDDLDRLDLEDSTTIASLHSELTGDEAASAVAVGIALVLAVAAALALSARLSRSILVPLKRLRRATERLTESGAAGPIAIEGDDELADLARAFNEMAAGLAERREAVELRERRLAALVENASDGILLLSAQATVDYATPSLRDEFDIRPDRTEPLGDRVHPDDVEHLGRAWQRILAEPGACTQVEARLMHADGTWRHVWARMSNRLDDPAVTGVVFNITDVSERHRYEQQLTWQALHDPLTGLANRELLRRRLDQPAADAPASVLYLDIDDFKVVNDTFGHESGDAFLREIAKRISDAVRPQDLVVRIGGDEFAVLLDGADGEQAAAAGERVLAAIRRPLVLRDRELAPRASVGVATAGEESTTVESLLGDADLAMYFTKRGDKGGLRAFEGAMRRELVEQVQLGEDLREALDRHQLTVAYQPVVRLSDGTVAGVEALARWQHPSRGAIPPSVFIPLAEQLRLVGRLDEWVLRQACRQLRAWLDAGLSPVRIAVNMSGLELANAALPDQIETILAETGVPADLLELELTESVAIAESEAERAVVHRLKALGVHLSIDDFGTGYSALGRLSSLPFDTLKVDKAFVDALGGGDAQNTTLVETILDMARSLGLDVIAEGVESAEQASILRQQDCCFAQGYYFSRPVAPEVIAAMLRVERVPGTTAPTS